ncbi:hypothetical protein HELRODRAFT_163957 [Helobdella robusta]|uniref:Uncharacterized protein n=1 Tax=Helobdella robusta TaxID=6412 RepID=T1EUN7_HELRO|nr:hypothetical protein HELRODRAFT_163957 [Helobdella robusta]ESN94171.1 hypothetical protein HELRODRAFT_163957 [Helobdella robusta]
MAELTRKKQDIYLLGQRLKTAILGNKLPAKGEVMRRFLYIHLSEKMTVRDNLFDIAHANAIELIQIQEDREFLLAQREPGRRGYMSGVDKNLALKEACSYERKRRQESYKLKSVQAQEEITAGACSAEIEHSSSDSSSECESEKDSIAKRVQVKRSRKSFSMSRSHCAVSRETAAAFDRTKTSDRKTTYIISGVAKHLGLNAGNLAINRSSIRRARHKHCQELALEIRRNFSPDVPLAVHWDWKLLLDLTGNQKVDRLPIVVEGAEVEKLLPVPKLESGTGERQATAVHECLLEWNLEESVKALVQGAVTGNYWSFHLFCWERHRPPRGVRVLQPGALYRARWMAKLIYAFKLYMYRHQFRLTRVEEKEFCRFIVFGICVYLRSWFTTPDLLSAARHDLQLVKRIQQFRDVDRERELAGAGFFDDQIFHEEKVLMADALSVESKTTNDFTKRVQMNINDISDEMSVKDFVSSNTMQFFAILGLPHSFLNKRPSEWREDEQYKKAFEVVSGIKPVNNFDERGVALMQDFNRAIVSSEEQKQYLL